MKLTPLLSCLALAASTYSPISNVPAQRANLIGLCHGQYYAAMYEDDFPIGCDWIEPIRVDGEPV